MKTFEDFKAAFPRLYSNVRCGWSCPAGWTDLVWRLSEQLEPLGAECDQVKEKFGSLRFYLRGPRDPRASGLITAAEDEAERTCDICGKPGTLGMWTKTYVRAMCPEHTPKDVEQPAAPEPETPEQVCERLGIDVPAWAAETREKVSAAQPAAPEQSADYLRGYNEGSDGTARELLAGKERDDKLADAVNRAAELVDWHKRAEAAETQLAAVREIIRQPGAYNIDRANKYKLIKKIVMGDVTPAPSPGAGFQALVDKVGDSADDVTVFATSKPPKPGAGEKT